MQTLIDWINPELSDWQWWALILVISGCFIFVFWIIQTLVDFYHADEASDNDYETFPCRACGNYKLWKKEGKFTCDCCGAKLSEADVLEDLLNKAAEK